MRMTDRERVHQMVDMRLDGRSYAEIGERYGITKQAVEIVFTKLKGSRGMGYKRPQKIQYPFIAQWLREHGMTYGDLAEETGVAYQTLYARLKGWSRFRVDEARRLTEYFGQPCEVVFRKEEQTE